MRSLLALASQTPTLLPEQPSEKWVAHEILVSAQGPLVLDFWVWGLGVWGLGLTIESLELDSEV